LKKVFLGEVQTGFIIGFLLGIIGFISVFVAFQDGRLALAVSASIVMAGTVASTLGLLLPVILYYLKMDPAFGSGPLATVIQDVLSLLIYLGAIQILL
jgi:magnesium transporter